LSIGPDRALVPLISLLGAHELRQIHALQARELARRTHGFIGFRLGPRDDAACLCAFVADDARQLPCVDLRDCHGLAATEEFLKARLGSPIAHDQRQVANDQPGCVGLRGFEIVGVRARVADVRVRERDDLAIVRGVGQDFLVAGHGGVEDHLAQRPAFGTH